MNVREIGGRATAPDLQLAKTEFCYDLKFHKGEHAMKKRSTGRKLRMECLEGRRLMAVFTVDDSFASDNVAQRKYNTIQEAVTAATAGDTIRVKPGTYEENVVVDKKLSIEGPNAPLWKYLDPNKAAIVDPVDDLVAGNPAIAFNLLASGISIQGFTIGEFDHAADPDGNVGIETSRLFSGYQIGCNVIENNTIGIYLNTVTGPSQSVKRTNVNNNVIRNNDVAGAASGNGIYSDQGLQNIDISCNTFSGRNFNAGITIVNAPDQVANPTRQTNVRIHDNSFKESTGGGIYVESLTDSSIRCNCFTRTATNGIQLNGGNQRVAIENNSLDKVGTLGYHGIILSNESGDGENQNNTIECNSINYAGLNGLVLRNSSFNRVKGNTIRGSKGFDLSDPNWGNGISLESASNNRIIENDVQKNARNGIFADAASIGNSFVENLSKNNNQGNVGAFDYNDQTTGGTGPSGVQNTYKKNKGKTQNVLGLIQKFV